MLKRLLSIFDNKKSVSDNTQIKTLPEATPTASPPDGNELIRGYDAYGREIQITRDEWRDKVLLPNLQSNWNDSDSLYGLIVSALNDGFAASLVSAANRLIEIDARPERSHTIQGIVFMKNSRLDEAESTLRVGLAKAGDTGTLLTNLAKVIFERGEERRALEILWRAVQKEPNMDNGLMWWASIQKERGGEAGYLSALQTVSALPNSWRAKLWLARHYLEVGAFDTARQLYEDVLDQGQYEKNALIMISGDLGQHGKIEMLTALLSTVYQPEQHDPLTGLNLLQAYRELRRIDDGELLLSKLYALDLPPFKQRLDQFAQAFQQVRSETSVSNIIDPDQYKIVTRALNSPIWHYGLRNADWFFSQKSETTPQVGFFALSKIISEQESAREQREDDLGRLSRAIPLYMAEAVHYWTDFAATTYIMVVEGGGPVLSGIEPEGTDLFDNVPADMDWFVTGKIGCNAPDGSGDWKLSMRLWDRANRKLVATETETTNHEALGSAVLRMELRLLAHLGSSRNVPMDDFYARPLSDMMNSYLVELGQSFMLTLLANDAMSKDTLWGERNMLEWPLNMALQWPSFEVPKLMYLSGLTKALDYKSNVLPEFKARTLQFLNEVSGAKSPASKLFPLVWKMFGMEQELLDFQKNLPVNSDVAYREWLERVINPSDI